MTFVSYAQNFEDVMLWRALRHVGAGFYIDAGAQHPDDDSVTRAFYERGWSGINVEPVPANARRLQAARWRDTTLPIALGAQPGAAVLQIVEGTGLSTLDGSLAERHRADGWTVRPIPVVVETLAEVCRQHVRGPIHFLKIDVEGAEQAVLEGADFAAYRPWIILLEATEPNSTTETHMAWEDLLLAADYAFVWFDGLNRFYVANERHAELGPHFRVPPNVFDNFMRLTDAEAARQVAAAEIEAARLREQLAASEQRARLQAHEALHARTLADLRGQELARMAEVLAGTHQRHADAHAAWASHLEATERQLNEEHALAQAEGALARAERAAAQATAAMLDATYRSTSWRVTGPLRRLSALVGRAPPPPGPVWQPDLPPDGAAEPAEPPAPPAETRPAAAGSPVEPSVPPPPPARLHAVHQFHSGSALGDAVTNSMLLVRGILRGWGYASEIFVSFRGAGLANELHMAADLPPGDGHVLIVHHSMGFAAFDAIAASPAPKVLIYHNITPPEFLAGNPAMQEHARVGRAQLAQLRPRVAASLAMSEYNAIELRRLGFDAPADSTLLFDLDALRARATPANPRSGDAPFTVLFVGRVCAAKGQDDLLAAFAAFHAQRPASRLVLAGRHDDGPFVQALQTTMEALGLAPHVALTGLVSDDELHALYAGADLYVSLSHHEGFGVPLVEAMAHGVPVLAWPAAAVPYTLGGASPLLDSRAPGDVAAAMLALAADPARRAAIAERQHAALGRFALDRHCTALAAALVQAGAARPASPQARTALDANMRFTVFGHASGSYSLASVNRTLALALDGARPGHARLLPVAGEPALEAGPAAALMGRPAPDTGPEIVISQHYPVRVPDHRGDLLLAFFFWEESVVPLATIRQLNAAFDGVLAPSAFVAKALVDSGLSIPVATVGFAPRLAAFRPAPRLPGDGTFTFLHVSSCFPRKGVDALLAAYAAAFRATDPVRLLVKGFPNPHNDVADQMARLRSHDPDAPAITLIDQDLDDAAMAELFHGADAVVLPTRGEGFNIPAAEAMAAGIPLLVTGYGGHMDFCAADTARLLQYRFAPSGSHIASPGSVWAEPDHADLVKALRGAVEDKAAGAMRARAAAARAETLADAGAFARRVADAALNVMLAPRPGPPRLAWISTWGVRCGIAEYSQHLVGALAAGGAISSITVLCDRRTETLPDAPATVTPVPCWRVGDTGSLDELGAALAEAAPDLVVVQHQPGLFRWRDLAVILRSPAVAHRPAIVTLHNTRHLLDIDAEERRFAVQALQTAVRVVVHTAADLNRLRELGIAANTTLVPHGAAVPAPHGAAVPVPHGAAVPAPHGAAVPGPAPRGPAKADRPLPAGEAAPLIGCYGFFLPDKGIPQLIEAVALLRKQWPLARLRLVNAEYDLPQSAHEIAACRALAASLDVPVEWETSFLPHERSRALLAACDVVALAYQGSLEASSAAVRTALSAGPPVAVTPLPLFDEAADAVFRFGGTGAAAVADGLAELLGDAGRRAGLRAAGTAWLAARDWHVVAQRFGGMLRGLARAAQGAGR